MKFTKPAALLLALLFLTGCSTGADAPSDDTGTESADSAPQTEESADLLTEIQDRGELIIALEGTWSPWSFHDADGTLTGYDTEVGKLIARELGVEPVFVEGQWDGLFAGLDSGRYDIVINGVDVT